MAIERRRYVRVQIKILVEYRSKRIWQNVETLNLSQGGMFVVTDKIEPPGTLVDVLFEIERDHERKKIFAKAKVVWVRERPQISCGGKLLPVGMGLEFLKIFPSECKDFFFEVLNKIGRKDEIQDTDR